MTEDESEYTLREMLEDDINSAIYHRDIPKLESLIDSYGINTVSPDMGRTFIFTAVDYNRPDMLEWLIEHGADINHKDGSDDTALDFAARKGCLEIVKIFVRYGIALDAIGQDGLTALNWAIAMGHNDVANYLIKKGASLNIPDRVFNKSPRDRIYESKNQELISLIESKELIKKF